MTEPLLRRTRLSGWGRVVVVLCGVAVAIGLAIRLVLLVQPIGGDPGIYAYVGARILAGDLPYRDVFEQKPPGVLYAYAAAFWAFGRSMLAVQVLDLVAWAAVTVLLAGLCWTCWRDAVLGAVTAALAALLLNPTLQSGFKQVGQSETFVALWVVAALWLVTQAGLKSMESSGRTALLAFGAGFSCGLAVLFKYNAAAYAVACGLSLTLAIERARLGRALAALAGGLVIPIVLAAAYFWARGGLGAAYECTVLYNLDYTAGAPASVSAFVGRAVTTTYRFLSMNVLWTAGACGWCWLVWRAVCGDRRGVPLVLMVGAAFLAVLANARFYPQYFLQMLPLLAVCAAVAAVETVRGLVHRRHLLPAVAALVLVTWVGVRHPPFGRLAEDVRAAAAYLSGSLSRLDYYRRFGEYGAGGDFSLVADVEVATFLREHTRPEETVYIYGGEPLVLFLADRRSPSRFVWNDPFLAGWFRHRYGTADLIEELRRARPAYFIVLRNDQNAVDPVDSLTHFERDPRLQDYVRREYREAGWIEDFLLFQRKGL